jgi:hypothetical protein
VLQPGSVRAGHEDYFADLVRIAIASLNEFRFSSLQWLYASDARSELAIPFLGKKVWTVEWTVTASPDRTPVDALPMMPAKKTRHGALSFSARKWLRYLARAVDEELGDGAERAVLQGNDSIWSSRPWEVNRQDLKL